MRVLDNNARSRPLTRAPVVGAAVATAALCAVGVWVLWQVFVVGRTGRWLDSEAMYGAMHGRSQLWTYGQQVLSPVSSALYGAVGLVVVVAIAVVRRQWWMALLGAVLLGGPVATTQVLKREILTRPVLDDRLNAFNSLPSGHTTAVAATCAALLFVVAPRWRPVVAVAGVAYTVVTGWSTYVGHWHRPSDVLAAVAVVTAWSALVCAVLPLVRPARVEDSGLPATVWTVVGLAVAALVCAVVLALVMMALVDAQGGTLSGVTERRAEILAYGAGVVATACGVCAMVAVQLGLRTAAGRVAPARLQALAIGM